MKLPSKRLNFIISCASSVGGVQVVTKRLAAELSRLGYQIRIISVHSGKRLEDFYL